MGKARSRTEIASLARSHTETVIRMLIGIVTREDASPHPRIAAGLALLDRGWGKALQKVVLEEDRPPIRIVRTFIEPKPQPHLPNWDYDRYGSPDAPRLGPADAGDSETILVPDPNSD